MHVLYISLYIKKKEHKSTNVYFLSLLVMRKKKDTKKKVFKHLDLALSIPLITQTMATTSEADFSISERKRGRRTERESEERREIEAGRGGTR